MFVGVYVCCSWRSGYLGVSSGAYGERGIVGSGTSEGTFFLGVGVRVWRVLVEEAN